jgi:glycerate dehydrogenase
MQHKALARGDRTHFKALTLPHFEVAGKTIGLVGGTGNIGTAVAHVAKALGMRVLVWCLTGLFADISNYLPRC